MSKVICPACGAELGYGPDESPFCEQCGARLSQEPAPDEDN